MLNLAIHLILALTQPRTEMLGRPHDLIFSILVTDSDGQQEAIGLLHLKEMHYPPFDLLQRRVYAETILGKPSDAISYVVGYFVLPPRHSGPSKKRAFPVVGERRDGSLKLRFDGSVDFDRVKRREDFVPHSASTSLKWQTRNQAEPGIDQLEISGLSEITSILSVSSVQSSELVFDEINFSGTIRLGGSDEIAAVTFWSIAGYPDVPRIGLYSFSPVSKLAAVLSFQKDSITVEKFMRSFNRLEKEFGIARLQENFFSSPENVSQSVVDKMESIIHADFPVNLSLERYAELGIQIFGSWKAVLGIGCGLVKTSHLSLVAKDTNRPFEVLYGYSVNSSGRYVRYREIQLQSLVSEKAHASFNQTTWLMRSEAIEPFEMNLIH